MRVEPVKREQKSHQHREEDQPCKQPQHRVAPRSPICFRRGTSDHHPGHFSLSPIKLRAASRISVSRKLRRPLDLPLAFLAEQGWQLSNVTRNAPRLILSQHFGNLRVTQRLA